ncbi:MAG: DNA translocase FtsK [Candidatus Omnitrophica bacterium]|nr:DNA translocase FtsK [Candidatus Omnitrophota bacterium]
MKNLSSVLKSVVLFFISLLITLSLISFTPRDITFLSASASKTIHNLIGAGGAYLGFFLFFIFGRASYFLPFYFFFSGLDKLRILRFSGLGRNKIINTISFLFFIIFLSVFIGLFPAEETEAFKSSGAIGFFLAGFFKKYLGFCGAVIVVSFVLVVNSLLLFGFFFADLFGGVKFLARTIVDFLRRLERKVPRKDSFKDKVLKPQKVREASYEKEIKPQIKVYTPKISIPSQVSSVVRGEPGFELKAASSKDKIMDKEAAKKKMEDLESKAQKGFNPHTYKLPSLEILKVPTHSDCRQTKEEIHVSIKNLEETLSDFGVEARVTSVQKGPVVTMYEMQPQAGVKIQKISALADDIALAMKSCGVRIVAPLPGRGTIGVEIPNEKKQLVFLREVLEEKVFINSTSKLTLSIGKDVSGNPVIADLKEMPHLLIAGATGAGKTVCVNSLISSILFKSRPDEVKFILIDPKMVELACFAGIPHLIHPIISEAKKAFIALNWAVGEMERRYRLLAAKGVRNIDMYNKSGDKLPFIIIIVDELADLMIVARESIETAIQRLAQLSRAVGIHLVLATQRPSVDVITGIIKANFPARISFKVSSRVDSRTVLDNMGAEKLLGMGDLLFLKPGAMKLIRAQGTFIDDEDIENLTNFIRAQGGPIFEEGIAEEEKKRALNIEDDELYDEAVEVILRARQASASMLQRRLSVGYTRAARLLDLMEQKGVVGPFCGSKAREILVDAEKFLAVEESI